MNIKKWISTNGMKAEADGYLALDKYPYISTEMALKMPLFWGDEWHHVRRDEKIVEMPFALSAKMAYKMVLRRGECCSARHREIIFRKLLSLDRELAINILGRVAVQIKEEETRKRLENRKIKKHERKMRRRERKQMLFLLGLTEEKYEEVKLWEITAAE